MEYSDIISPDRRDERRKNYFNKTPGSNGRKFGSKGHYQSMFKTSPLCLQSFRDKCIIEMNNRRQIRKESLRNRFRNIDSGYSKDLIIQEVMKNVWQEMDGPEIDPDGVTFEDLFQQLKQDLLNEEIKYWEEYNERMLEEMINNQDSITCMKCLRDILIINVYSQSYTLIQCQSNCGLSLFVNYPVEEKVLNHRLQNYLDEHKCSGCINFMEMDYNPNINHYTNIVLYCPICNFKRLLF